MQEAYYSIEEHNYEVGSIQMNCTACLNEMDTQNLSLEDSYFLKVEEHLILSHNIEVGFDNLKFSFLLTELKILDCCFC